MALMPKRVKHRKSQRGRIKGSATRGNRVVFGEFGLQATEGGWVSAATIEAVFDLITTYDTVFGPLWVSGSTVTGFNRGSVSDEDIHWVIYHVMQYIMDEVYNPDTIAAHEALLDGFVFGSSAHFPGSVAPPADPNNTHTVSINGTPAASSSRR